MDRHTLRVARQDATPGPRRHSERAHEPAAVCQDSGKLHRAIIVPADLIAAGRRFRTAYPVRSHFR